jgi:ribosomal protein S18 acetylase RimI-like enzyme
LSKDEGDRIARKSRGHLDDPHLSVCESCGAMADESFDCRTYAGSADLALLQDFASRALAARFPLDATWHRGDFSWQLMPHYDQPHPVRMWFGRAGLEAVAMFETPGKLLLEIVPSSERLLAEMLARAGHAALRGGQSALLVRVFDSDVQRIAALKSLGYTESGPESVSFRIALAKPLVLRAPHTGYRLRDCVGIDAEKRAAAHRDAWNDLSAIGLPDTRSSFSAEVYRGLRAAPGYDPTLDILVEAPSGELVANCIAWADHESRIGTFEPVGTHARYRRQGLARLAVQEGLRRLQERGMRFGRVSTAHFNAPAIATYAASGFELHDRASWWSKALVA